MDTVLEFKMKLEKKYGYVNSSRKYTSKHLRISNESVYRAQGTGTYCLSINT